MKSLMLMISMQLIGESLQRLIGLSDIRGGTKDVGVVSKNPQCWNKIDSSSGSCASCTFCKPTDVSGNQISEAACSPCNTYTWTHSHASKTVQTLSTANSSSTDNLQRFWYADCASSSSHFTDCNFCYTCVRSSNAPTGWNCANCKAWSNLLGQSSNSSCRYSTFDGVDRTYDRYLIANCSACDTVGTDGSVIGTRLNCWPAKGYKFWYNDYAVHSYNTTNITSLDGIQQTFTSDCVNPSISTRENNCVFTISCGKRDDPVFGFDCFFGDSNSSNTTNRTRNLTYSTWDAAMPRSIQSRCIFNTSDLTDIKVITCVPLFYTWRTSNTSVDGNIWVKNFTSTNSLTQYFTSDCLGPNMEDCYWVTGCSKSNPKVDRLGYKCWVFNAYAPRMIVVSEYENYDPYTGTNLRMRCIYNNATDPMDQILRCEPYDYIFKTYDTGVRYNNITNLTTGLTDFEFLADCTNLNHSRSDTCYWVGRCYARVRLEPYQCTVSNFRDAWLEKETNYTTQAFSYDAGNGTDWCTNCTQSIKGPQKSMAMDCKPCTSSSPFNTVRCTNQMYYFENKSGNTTCAACTSCNTGFFNCAPCDFVNFGALKHKMANLSKQKALRSNKSSGAQMSLR